MGISNRFRSSGQPTDDSKIEADIFEQDALRLIEEGHALEAEGRNDEAMQRYLDAIRLAPNPARAHLNHGNVLLLKGDLDGALDAFRTAIKHKPDYAGAYYNIGNALLGRKLLDEAVANYRRALEINPDYAEVHCALGVAMMDLGQFQDAAASCRRTLELKPDMVEAHYNLGLALQGLGQIEGAAASYRRAVELKPDLVEAHKNLGFTLQHLGQLEGAVASYRRAVELKPDLFEVHNNIGLALQYLGQLEDAVASYRRAAELRPDLVEAHNNLGNTQKKLGQFQDAAASYRRALEIMPDYADAHSNLGVVLHDLGRYEEALASYQRALKIKPDFAEAHSNLGATLKEQGKLTEAAASYRLALEIKPDLADAYSNLGVVLYDLGQQKDAVAYYRLALKINPDLAVALANLGSAFKEFGEFSEADICYKRALEIEPENAIYRVAQMFNLPIAPQTVEASVAVPNNFDRSLKNLSDWMLSVPEQHKKISEALNLQTTFYLAYRYGNHVALLSRFGDMVAASSQQTSFKSAPKRDRLRLVVVSNHFRRHSVWDVILRGLLVNLDRTRFEVVLYNTSNEVDGETNLAKSLADAWRDFSTVAGLNGWLEAMAADQPDVIFYPEIGMDRMTLNLATRRLAPLQVASWGHPITTGLPTIDMYFSGELLEPPDADKHYREKLVRLPGTGCCTAPIELKPEGLHQLSADLSKRRGPRFVIAQSPFKFDPTDDALFASIAAAVGECTFILVSDPKLPWAMERLIDRLKQTFVERNLDPEKYFLVVQWMPREKFYTLLNLSDIFLDCPSFSGYTTAWQAVQRGLPVLTLEGKFMRQRLAAGLLRKIGVTDTIAASEGDYVAIAVRLAAECRDPEHRDARRRLLSAAAALADNDISVVRMFEQSLIEALAERGRHFEFGTARNTPPNSIDPANPASVPAWKMLDADIHLHTLEPNYAPVGLLEMVNPSPKRVLDLGCFCGGSGRWLKQRFPGCEVTGIEMLDEAAAMAAQTYEQVITGTFEQVDFEKEGLKPGSFDAIIAADVLEHLYNPWQALQRLKPLLAQGGAIYVSLPNIRNLNVLSALASGEWRYEGAGILDVTHIRFFTLAQATEMLTQTGWIISDARMNPDPSLTGMFEGNNLDEMKSISMGKLKLEGLKKIDVVELIAVQFFIRAVP